MPSTPTSAIEAGTGTPVRGTGKKKEKKNDVIKLECTQVSIHWQKQLATDSLRRLAVIMGHGHYKRLDKTPGSDNGAPPLRAPRVKSMLVWD